MSKHGGSELAVSSNKKADKETGQHTTLKLAGVEGGLTLSGDANALPSPGTLRSDDSRDADPELDNFSHLSE